MRRFLAVTTLAVLAGAAFPALAAECLDGFRCDHVCPLAREANGHRSAGAEGVFRAPTLRATLAASVEKNVRRI